MKRSIEVPGVGHNAPIPYGARVGPLVCSSAISGKDPATGALPGDPKREIALAFGNLDRFLAAAGATLADVAKLSVALADDAHRGAVNDAWLQRFPDPHDRPARHIDQRPLPHGLSIQLECIAWVAAGGSR